MTFTVEQKSQLAKLLATENIRIEHQKIRTAMFDVKNRVLYLPIWKDMTGNLYDLLVGHEVGHALYTPSQGWHNAIDDSSKPKTFKNFLNVVEDARIEKKIQRRYPGLRSSFRIAYDSLIEKDFFKIKDRNLSELSFIDRLNLYTKSQYTMQFDFNEVELDFIEDVKSVESWEDVVDVANRIFEYSKKEQQELEMEQSIESVDYGDDFEDSDDFEDGNTQVEFDEDGEESSFDKEDDEESYLNREKESQMSFKDQYVPSCETDEAYRQNEEFLVDEKSKDYLYLNFPEIDISKTITPAWAVHKQITDYYNLHINNGYYGEEKVNELVNAFKLKNERYVSLLAKEFEMNKAAKAYSKNRVSETGEIDISKLSSYKFDDNIFRKVTIVPKGKSHGLILLLDCSGSMTDNMAGSIEQILILAMFCRKVNIPFRMFGFNDSYDVFISDENTLGTNNNLPFTSVRHMTERCGFSKKNKDLGISFCRLREYLNSSLSAAEYSKCFKNMVLLYNSYVYTSPIRGRPTSESLSNTPLVSAIVACQKVIKLFKKENNLDLTNMIIVHDGDSDTNNNYYNDLGVRNGFSTTTTNVYLVDKTNKYMKKLNTDIGQKHDTMLECVLDWFTVTTKSKVFGFYLLENTNYRIDHILEQKYYGDFESSYRLSIEEREDLRKKLKTEKFLKSNNPGYSSFFFIAGGNNLRIENDELQISGEVTQTKLKSAFMKMNKKKQVSRVFVNQFIKGIAA